MRTARGKSDESETHRIRYETLGPRRRLQLHSPIWIKEIHIFWLPHQRALTDRFGVYPTGNNFDSSSSVHFEAARFLRWGYPTPSRHSAFPGAHMSNHVVTTAPCSIIAALTSFLLANFAIIYIAILVEREVQKSRTYDDRRCSF